MMHKAKQILFIYYSLTFVFNLLGLFFGLPRPLLATGSSPFSASNPAFLSTDETFAPDGLPRFFISFTSLSID